MNDTSELDAILDRVYGAGYEMAQLHSQGKGTTKRTLTSDTIYAAKKALAQREQAAELRGRIDELRLLAGATARRSNGETWEEWAYRVVAVLENRLAELQTTNPRKGVSDE